MSDVFETVKQRVVALCPPWPVKTTGRALALLDDAAVRNLNGLPDTLFGSTVAALLEQAGQGGTVLGLNQWLC